MDLESHLRGLLAAAKATDLLRSPQAYEPEGAFVRTDAGTALLSFASNDYLGLAESPVLRRALAAGAEKHAGAGSSRIVAGTSPAHHVAEAALAEFVRLPASRIFSSAYAANVALLGSLFAREDLILSDSLNHASLIDGCRLSRARVEIYDHGDLDHLRDLLRRHRGAARVTAVVTETAFSMDGDVADVRALHSLAEEFSAALIVDEAHALGVIGPRGAGVCAEADVRPDVLIGGLGKSFGLAGGFAAGSTNLARAFDNFGRTFVFSTAILPAIAHATPRAVELVVAADVERALLQRHAASIRESANRARRRVLGRAPAAIVPIVLGQPEVAMSVSHHLRKRGFLVPAMRPPTVAPGESRIRITPTALHTPDQVAALCDALSEALA